MPRTLPSYRPLILLLVVTAGLTTVTACSGDSASTPAAASAAASPSDIPTLDEQTQKRALTAAGCQEITRITREEMKGLVDDDPSHWDRFATELQAIADGVGVEEFSTATTDMATAALEAADSLRAGQSMGVVITTFQDSIPAVDSACKQAGAPLN